MTSRTLTIIAIAFVALSFGCSKKKLGEACKTNKDCEKGSTCLTVEGKATCTKLCASDKECPENFVCARLKVKIGYSATAVPQTYCLEKKFLKKADQKSRERQNAKTQKEYDKLKMKGTKLAPKQLDALKGFWKKHKVALRSGKVVYLTLIYFSSYGALWTKTVEAALKKENKLWKDKIRLIFVPIPFEKAKENYGVLLGYDILRKKGPEEYWRYHKRLISKWSTASYKRTAVALGKKHGYDKKAVAALPKNKELALYLKDLTDLKETLDLSKDPMLLVGDHLFKANDVKRDLKTLTVGYSLELKARYAKSQKSMGASKKNPAPKGAKKTPAKK